MSSSAIRAALCALALALVSVSSAAAQTTERDVQRAKLEAGILDEPNSAVDTPVGELRIVNPELIAARFDQRITFELQLDRDVDAGSVRVALPRRWRSRPASGIRTTAAPQASARARGMRVARADSALVLELEGARAGATLRAEIADHGIPAGEYTLPASLVHSDGRTEKLDPLEMRLYAPIRESSDPENPWNGVRAINVTDDDTTESETYVTVVPGNAQRILVGVNGGGGYNAWISTNGGATWTKRAVPTTADLPASNSDGTLSLCCDPMSAADAAGNIWYGGLSTGSGSRIHVSRIAAGTDTFVNTVGLPRRTTGTQDKPMMTIDNKSTSPTFGRLYVAWNEPAVGGGLNIVAAMCDTRPSGNFNAANCDNADNWSGPVSITKATGSVIYADVAVGPDGKVYATWWDFSSTNAIVGSVCDPQVSSCATAAGWSAQSTIAILDSTGGAAVPFACPIPAQPGGRAGPSPGVETDVSGTSSDGTVYVTWGDLRPSSGSTRCDDGATPQATHLSWDSFVAAASNQLPGASAASSSAGRRLATDGENGGSYSSDEWFPWLAVDQTTGVAYANFYSTRGDATRKTTRLFVRSVNSSKQLGARTEASSAASDYSASTCCTFGNDYGDYTGIDATGGTVIPVWSEKLAGVDGEAMVNVMSPGLPAAAPVLAASDAAAVDASPGGDGDGVAEPGETLKLDIDAVNDGDAAAPGTTGVLTSPSLNATVVDGSASYGSVGAATSAAPDAPYQVKLAKTTPCGAAITLDMTVTSGTVTGSRGYTIETGKLGGPKATGLPVSIPEDSTGVDHVLTVPAGSGTITDLDVGMSITHPWVGDVVVTLAHNGTTITLVRQPGGPNNGADNFTGTVFDDEAATAIGSAAAPFTGRYRPNQALSAFDGMSMDGTWTLNVKDVYPDASNGSLTAWGLPKPVCEVSPQAVIAGPDTAQTGQQISLDAGSSVDPDGSVDSYAWDLDGDGQFDDATGALTQTSFTSAGAKVVKVEITDNAGLTAQASKTITVSAPVTGTGTGPGNVIDAPVIPGPIAGLLKPNARVKPKRGVFRLGLGGCARCKGTIVIQSAKKLRVKRSSRAKKIRLARGSFTLGTTGLATMRGKLSKTNQALLRRLRRIPAIVRITVTNSAGKSATRTQKITFIR